MHKINSELDKSLKGLFKFIAPLVTNVLFPGMGAIGKGILTGGIGSLLAGAKPKEALKNAAGKDKIEIKKFARFKVGEGI